MNRNIKKIFFTLILSCLLFFSGQNVLTATAYYFNTDSGLDTTGGQSGAGYTTTGSTNWNISLKVGSYIQIVLSFLGVIFLVLMIYAGYLWMTARGEEQSITKAQSIIKNSIIGLIIVLAAYIITMTISSLKP